MKKYFPIIVVLVVAVLLFFCSVFVWIGWNGVGKTRKIEESGCSFSYFHYYIPPFLKDSYDCRNIIPCPYSARIDEEYAKSEILECLCENKEQNEEAIVNYYEELSGDIYDYEGADEICDRLPTIYNTPLE